MIHRLFVHKFTTLIGLLILLSCSIALLFSGCEWRVCKAFNYDLEDGGTSRVVDHSACKGFTCDPKLLLCRNTCENNTHCDHGKELYTGIINEIPNYICIDNQCICNPNKINLACHRSCRENKDCNDKKDPVTKAPFSVDKGYTCELAEDGMSRQCICTKPEKGCTKLSEPIEEDPDNGNGDSGEEPLDYDENQVEYDEQTDNGN
jgi:hypothetical protein